MSKKAISIKLNSKLVREAEQVISDGVHSDMEYLLEVALASYLTQLRINALKVSQTSPKG